MNMSMNNRQVKPAQVRPTQVTAASITQQLDISGILNIMMPAMIVAGMMGAMGKMFKSPAAAVKTT